MTYLLDKLRSRFFSPNSSLELKLRTCYHRLTATRMYFKFQAWRAIRSYNKFRAYQRSLVLPNPDTFSQQPKVSFMMNLQGDEDINLRVTIDSILNLTSPNWEIILISSAGWDEKDIQPIHRQDQRINIVGGHSLDSKKISGDYLIFCAPGDVFFKGLISRFFESYQTNPSADVYYYDGEYQSPSSTKPVPLFKPITHSPELLLSSNYCTRALIKIETLQDNPMDLGNRERMIDAEYDAVLKISENKGRFQHIPYLLLTQTELITSSNVRDESIFRSHFQRLGMNQASSEKVGGEVRFSWQINDPSVAIIIPSKNHYQLLKGLIDSILEKTDYPDYTINIVDNNSDNRETQAYYEHISDDSRFSIIPYNAPFNYSQAINLGVENTQSELVLFLNDDMQVIDPYWLGELAQWAHRADIGVVGAKLLRENHTIQHAGIIIGLNGFAGHFYLNAPEDYHGLFGSANWYRNLQALTGACQMVRRDLFTKVGGYDEKYRLAFGDIDFCLRVQECGYRNMLTPFARLFHYEGKSRGYQTPVKDILHGYNQLQDYLIKDDPYYSPNLTYTRIPRCSTTENTQAMRTEQMKTRKTFYKQKG